MTARSGLNYGDPDRSHQERFAQRLEELRNIPPPQPEVWLKLTHAPRTKLPTRTVTPSRIRLKNFTWNPCGHLNTCTTPDRQATPQLPPRDAGARISLDHFIMAVALARWLRCVANGLDLYRKIKRCEKVISWSSIDSREIKGVPRANVQGAAVARKEKNNRKSQFFATPLFLPSAPSTTDTQAIRNAPLPVSYTQPANRFDGSIAQFHLIIISIMELRFSFSRLFLGTIARRLRRRLSSQVLMVTLQFPEWPTWNHLFQPVPVELRCYIVYIARSFRRSAVQQRCSTADNRPEQRASCKSFPQTRRASTLLLVRHCDHSIKWLSRREGVLARRYHRLPCQVGRTDRSPNISSTLNRMKFEGTIALGRVSAEWCF